MTAIPGVVFSGSLDGHLRAYGTDDGRVLWDFDTVKSFKEILEGKHDDVPEGNFYMKGGINERWRTES